MKMDHMVFISYSEQDGEKVERVRQELQKEGIKVWMAPDSIAAGEDCCDAIQKAIEECSTFLLILSANSQSSNNIIKEIDKAICYKKPIVPLKIDNEILTLSFDFMLTNIQMIETDSNSEICYADLSERIKIEFQNYEKKLEEKQKENKQNQSNNCKSNAALTQAFTEEPINNIVFDYLDSIDSVRKSDMEVVLGQNELIDRLLYTDHTVVLTMQQLTDSRVFGNLLRDNDCTDYILYQFIKGRLRYSQYGDIKTPSQYIQNSLLKCKNKGYLFSYLPIKQEDTQMLNAELNALKNGSLEYLEELKNERKNEQEQIEFLENYTRLILHLGTLHLARTTPKPQKYCRKLIFFLVTVLEAVPQMKVSDLDNDTQKAKDEITRYYSEALEILKDVFKNLKDKELEQNRTEWHNYLRDNVENDKRCSYYLAEAIIDVAYNLTVADSINGCFVPEGEELKQMANTKLVEYWKLARTSTDGIWINDISTYSDVSIHKFLKEDEDATYDWNIEYDKIKEQWKFLKTLTEDMEKIEKQRVSKRSWSSRLKNLSFQLIINCILAIVVYGIVEAIASIDYLTFFSEKRELISKIMNCTIKDIFINIINIFIIGTIFTLFSKFFKVQDFLDSLKKLWRGVRYGCLSYQVTKKLLKKSEDDELDENK